MGWPPQAALDPWPHIPMTSPPRFPPALTGPGPGPVRHDGAGGQHLRLEHYALTYYPRSTQNLVVTFDPRMKSYPPSETREPWARGFLERYGVSALHVKPDGSSWYRLPDLEAAFRDLAAAGFFAGFDSVMTYGGSMGGFGALAFAGITGADRVLSLNPQVNLGPEVRSWEKRYRDAERLGWDAPICDIGQQLRQVATPVVVYDPYHAPDRKQVELIDAPHLVALHVPFVGHRMPGHLQSMRLLAPLFHQVLTGHLDIMGFCRLARRRRTLWRYKDTLLFKSIGHPARQERITRLLQDGNLLGVPGQRVIDDED